MDEYSFDQSCRPGTAEYSHRRIERVHLFVSDKVVVLLAWMQVRRPTRKTMHQPLALSVGRLLPPFSFFSSRRIY
jgi:hypothetical protein